MTGKEKASVIGNIVISLLILAGFVFFVIFAVGFWEAATAPETGDFDTDLGNGLGMAITLVIMIVTDICIAVLCIIGSVWSGSAMRVAETESARITLKVTLISDIAMTAAAVIYTAVVIIMSNLGAF